LTTDPSDGRLAVYAGTFDPPHFGHVDIVRRSARLFDRVLVAVVVGSRKNVLFSVDERVQLFRDAILDLPNVEVQSYSGLTVAFAESNGASALVRGLRTAPDFEYELQLTTMNRHLRPNVEAVFLMTAQEHAHLSSSLIKEVASLGAPLDGMVPPHVAEALAGKFANAQ
jgi:pantetheine-phosphate adenylyltransferase